MIFIIVQAASMWEANVGVYAQTKRPALANRTVCSVIDGGDTY